MNYTQTAWDILDKHSTSKEKDEETIKLERFREDRSRRHEKRVMIKMLTEAKRRRIYELESDFQSVAEEYYKKKGHRIMNHESFHGGWPDIITEKSGIRYIVELKRDIGTSFLYSVVGQLVLRRFEELKQENTKTIYQACFPYRYKKKFSEELITFLAEYKIDVVFI